MGSSPEIAFGPFRLDRLGRQLLRGDEPVELQAKPLAVLTYLAENPGKVVSKEELLAEVWAGVHVDKAALKVCIWAIRRALGDAPRAPQYVETVGRRGYRFCWTEEGTSGASREPAREPAPTVGREEAFRAILGRLGRAAAGTRQVVFLTGEPGVGKTTVVDLLERRVRELEDMSIVRGHCLEQFGAGEPYLPIFEALREVCRGAGARAWIATLSQHAPSWLAQMPGLLDDSSLAALRARAAGATKDRMLREIADALEAFALERTFVLVLEDLQWSDHATLDLLGYLAQRRARARLFVVATYRPAEAVVREHPLRQLALGLQGRGQSVEIPLELLAEQDIESYLVARLGAAAVTSELVRFIHRRTEGNALFMASMVDLLESRDLFVTGAPVEAELEAVGMPETLRQLILKQVEARPGDEYELLEAASVAGVDFTVASVAAALNVDTDRVEQVCEELAARGLFIREIGVAKWEDGSISSVYGFRHALHQQVLYDQLAGSRRARLHRRIAERLEVGFGAQAGQIAAELASHFERGRAKAKAVPHLVRAGDRALERGAHQEAAAYLTRGLACLETLTATPERDRQELALRVSFGTALQAVEGPASAEAERHYSRARELCELVGGAPQLFPALVGLCKHYQMSTKQQTALGLAKTLLSQARALRDDGPLVVAHWAVGQSAFFLGHLEEARDHFEESLARYDADRRVEYVMLFGSDPFARCRYHAAHTRWLLGDHEHMRHHIAGLLELTGDETPPFARAVARFYAARLCVLTREEDDLMAHVEALGAVAVEHRYAYLSVYAEILRGYVLVGSGASEEGMELLRDGVRSQAELGTQSVRPMFLSLLAMAAERADLVPEGLEAVEEGIRLSRELNVRYLEPELLRLRGSLLLHQGEAAESEASDCLQRALALAREQRARAWETRIATSLGALYAKRGDRRAAATLLAEVIDRSLPDSDSADLREARALRATLT